MPPETPLRLLHVEDSEFDHALLQAQVAAEGVPADWHCVQSEEAFLQALEQTWDHERIRRYAQANTWERRVDQLVGIFEKLTAQGGINNGEHRT